MATDWNVHREWARRFILDHPAASIDDIARAANAARHDLPRNVISEIRRDTTTAKPAVRPTPVPFNPPKLVAPTPPATPPAPPAPVAPPPPVQPAMERGTSASRRRFVDDYVLAHPDSLHTDVAKALKEKFGVAVDSGYITEALRAVRSASGVIPARGWAPDQLKGNRAPARTVVTQGAASERVGIDAAIVEAARALKVAMLDGRIRKVVLTIEDAGDEKFELDFATELHMGRTGRVTV